MLFRRINFRIIQWSTLFLTLLFIPGFLAAMAEEEGTLGDSFFTLLFLSIFEVLNFPTQALFWHLFSASRGLYILGLFVNFLFFSFLIERLIFFVIYYRMPQKDKSELRDFEK